MDLAELGKWLKARREGFGMTRAILAGKIGVSANYIYMIEQAVTQGGRPRRPSMKVLSQWLDQFDTGWDEREHVFDLAGYTDVFRSSVKPDEGETRWRETRDELRKLQRAIDQITELVGGVQTRQDRLSAAMDYGFTVTFTALFGIDRQVKSLNGPSRTVDEHGTIVQERTLRFDDLELYVDECHRVGVSNRSSRGR